MTRYLLLLAAIAAAVAVYAFLRLFSDREPLTDVERGIRYWQRAAALQPWN